MPLTPRLDRNRRPARGRAKASTSRTGMLEPTTRVAPAGRRSPGRGPPGPRTARPPRRAGVEGAPRAAASAWSQASSQRRGPVPAAPVGDRSARPSAGRRVGDHPLRRRPVGIEPGRRRGRRGLGGPRRRARPCATLPVRGAPSADDEVGPQRGRPPRGPAGGRRRWRPRCGPGAAPERGSASTGQPATAANRSTASGSHTGAPAGHDQAPRAWPPRPTASRSTSSGPGAGGGPVGDRPRRPVGPARRPGDLGTGRGPAAPGRPGSGGPGRPAGRPPSATARAATDRQ